MRHLVCEGCGDAMPEAVNPNRRWCSDRCRKRASRAGIASARTSPRPPATPLRPVSGLLDAVTAELEAAKRLHTVGGQLALELARRITDAPPMNTGVAALSKQLTVTMAQALSGAERPGRDPVDQLKKRRDSKRRAARR